MSLKPSGILLEKILLCFILLVAIMLPLETLPDMPELFYIILSRFELIVTALFLGEYIVRVWLESRKRDYILSFYGLIDLLAIAPYFLGTVGLQEIRALRLLRIFRLVKGAQYSAALQRFITALKETKVEMTVFAVSTMILLYLAASGIYFFEHAAQPDVFKSIPHAWWWAIATLTTVGYGDIYPVTDGGKAFTSIIVLLGIGVVSVPTGIIASALMRVKDSGSNTL